MRSGAAALLIFLAALCHNRSHCPVVRQRRSLASSVSRWLQLSAASLLESCRKSPCFIFHIKNLNSIDFHLHLFQLCSTRTAAVDTMTPRDPYAYRLCTPLDGVRMLGHLEESHAHTLRTNGMENRTRQPEKKKNSKSTLAEMQTVI